jgi:hypothetical protein
MARYVRLVSARLLGLGKGKMGGRLDWSEHTKLEVR